MEKNKMSSFDYFDPDKISEEEKKRMINLYESRIELHKLMRRVIVSTKLGRQNKEPYDDLELDIGDGSLFSSRVSELLKFFCEEPFIDIDLEYDLEAIKYLIEEINKRFEEFKRKRNSDKKEYIKGKKKFAREIFDRPLSKLYNNP